MGNYSCVRHHYPVKICVSSLTSNDYQANIRQVFAPIFAFFDGISYFQLHPRRKFCKSVASLTISRPEDKTRLRSSKF